MALLFPATSNILIFFLAGAFIGPLGIVNSSSFSFSLSQRELPNAFKHSSSEISADEALAKQDKDTATKTKKNTKNFIFSSWFLF